MARASKKDVAAIKAEAEAALQVADSEIAYQFASEVPMEKKRWLWRNHLLIGALEILTGASTIGKGQVHVQFVKCVTTGCAWPDGQPGCEPGYVIMLGSEDMKAQELKPRLVAAGADDSRVIFVNGIRRDKKSDRMFLLEEDIDKLERLIVRLASEGKVVKLITIDPITNYVGRKTNNSQNVEVRAQLTPLVEMLERRRCSCSVITHPAKGAGANAADHYNGAGAYVQVPRIGHMCIKEYDGDGLETGRALFTMVATNAGKMQKSIAYKIETKHVVGDDKELDHHPYIVWDGEVAITANQAVHRQKQHFKGAAADEEGPRDAVADFLLSRLRRGPAPCEPIVREGMELFGVSRNLIWKVSKKMHVVARKGNKANDPWIWTHPDFPGQEELGVGTNLLSLDKQAGII